MFFEISQNSQESTCATDSFLIKLQACNFIKKESLVQVLSCEFSEISKNTFFTEHLQETASFTCNLYLFHHNDSSKLTSFVLNVALDCTVFCQVNSNLLQYKHYKNIPLSSACVLICSTSCKMW